jgi:hypothetical protein
MAASLFLSAFAHILQENTQRAQLRIIRLSALRRGANCRRCFGQWAASVPTDSSTVMADFWFGAFSGEPESSHALQRSETSLESHGLPASFFSRLSQQRLHSRAIALGNLWISPTCALRDSLASEHFIIRACIILYPLRA